MKTLLLNLLALTLLLMAAGCPLSQNCEGLVYEADTNTCICPMGTEPDYELDACVGDDGLIIPWGGLNVPLFDSGVSDAGTDALDSGSTLDMGSNLGDGSVDGGADRMDVGAELDMQMPDAGPPPAPTSARFPWNGFTTGSVHAADEVANHPLRPKFMWEEVAEADHYQVQMTRECELANFRDCAFSSNELDVRTDETTFRPETALPVSMTQPVGDRYYWRVRSCSAAEHCSDWTDVRYVDVGRDSHDFNGDGYGDILAGGTSGVSVFLGSNTGPHTSGRRLNDPRGAEFYGLAGKTADFDGDGFADLAIGDPQHDAVYVYLGAAAGPPATPNHTLFAPGRPSGTRFGGHVSSAGDTDGDGYAELLVTGGGTFLFAGTAIGPAAIPLALLETLSPTSAGDVNGDGFTDVVGGVDTNSSHVFLGGNLGLETAPSLNLAEGTARVFHAFGSGDLNGDGFSDIVIGNQTKRAAYLFEGTSAGPVAAADRTVEDSGAPDNPFGSSTTVADINGDGFDDLLVGAVGTAVYLFPGSPSGPAATFTATIPNPEPETLFGQKGSTADYNGDGYIDFITASWHPEFSGAQVLVYLGLSTGISVSPNATLWAAGRRFGSTLAYLLRPFLDHKPT